MGNRHKYAGFKCHHTNSGFVNFINRKKKSVGIERLCYDSKEDATDIFINLKGENRLT